MLRARARNVRPFSRVLRVYWRGALDRYAAICVAAEEIGKRFHDRQAEMAEEHQDQAFYALTGLYARACRIAFEIHHALSGGFSMGALACSRTLRELVVIMKVLSDFGDEHPDLAERFLLHEVVQNWKDGTGKSTAMRAVREAWQATGGRVLGFAPSAVAASVLGDEPGVRANTIHSLLVTDVLGVDLDIQPGDMLLVDEAGMADTRALDGVRAIAAEYGAVVRLVGDHRQLSAVEAGGVLRLIYQDTGGVELTDVRRFADPAEAAAVLQFRVGDSRSLGFYASHGRLFGGVRAVGLDLLYSDWKADVAAGRSSIMMSDSADVARELSARAQAERRATGAAELGGVDLHDGSHAGVGDRIVTRKNRRQLAVRGGRDYVKNGDLWEVEKRHRDGRLTVRHVQHRGRRTLPTWYVREWVELGYAATIHRSQGMTVDTARAFLTTVATREAALVALSRGVHGNFAYLDTEPVLHPDEPTILPGDLFYRYREATPAERALAAILAREGAEPLSHRDSPASSYRYRPALDPRTGIRIRLRGSPRPARSGGGRTVDSYCLS